MHRHRAVGIFQKLRAVGRVRPHEQHVTSLAFDLVRPHKLDVFSRKNKAQFTIGMPLGMRGGRLPQRAGLNDVMAHPQRTERVDRASHFAHVVNPLGRNEGCRSFEWAHDYPDKTIAPAIQIESGKSEVFGRKTESPNPKSGER